MSACSQSEDLPAPSSPTSRPKLSITTVYPLELPKLKFYTERAIHEDPSIDPRNPLKQIPVTFIRYLRNKQKRRYSSRTQPAIEPVSNDSMLITNSLDRDRVEEAGRRQARTRAEEESSRFNSLLEKVGKAAKEREEKSTQMLNYYKKKFLKYKCRKSIELDPNRMQTVRKPFKRDDFLADGLKIEKI
jgi:hypothetical protein